VDVEPGVTFVVPLAAGASISPHSRRKLRYIHVAHLRAHLEPKVILGLETASIVRAWGGRLELVSIHRGLGTTHPRHTPTAP
jgi:hypothetical protein